MTERELFTAGQSYLRQAEDLERLVRSKAEQIARLEEMAVSAPQPITSSCSGRQEVKGSKVENLAVSIVMLREDLEKQSEELARRRIEISKTIGQLKDYRYQYLLNEKYLLYKKWDQIILERGQSRTHLLSQHRTAVIEIGRIIC